MVLTPFSPPPGLNSDDTTFSAEGGWADADGFRFFQGKPETIERHDTEGAATFTNVTKLLLYKVGSDVTIAAAGSALTRDPIIGAAVVITPATGWTGSRFCLDMWGDELLAQCSGGKLFTSVAGAQATEITQSPDQITAMIVTPERQVLALGCNEEISGTFNGRCIRGCDLEDYTDWTTTATNNAFEHILPGQANIVGGAVYGSYILVWTEDALWLGQFIGDPAQTYRFDKVAGGAGLVGLDAFAILDGIVYWVAPSLSFYVYSVGALPSQIPCPISVDFFDNAIGGAPSKIFACPVKRYREIWFSYGDTRDAPELGSQCTRFLVYHAGESIAAQRPVWSRGKWASLMSSQTAAGHMVDSALSPSSTKRDVFVASFGAGKQIFRAQQDTANGPAVSFIQSADQYIDQSQRRMMVRRFIPDFEYQSSTVSLALSSRDRPHSSATTATVTIATSDTKKDFRKSGIIMSVKLTPATGSRLRIGKPLFDVVPLGER